MVCVRRAHKRRHAAAEVGAPSPEHDGTDNRRDPASPWLPESTRRRADLADLYDRHGGSVYRIAHHICGPIEAELVTISVFLALWRAPDTFASTPDELRTSVLAAAHREAVVRMRAKREHRGGTEEISPAEAERAALGDSGRTAGSPLSELPAAERQAIQLAFFGGRTCREIATFLHLSENVISSRIGLGMAHLRTLSTSGIGKPAPVERT